MFGRRRTPNRQPAPPPVLPPGEQEAYDAEVGGLATDMARTGLWLGCNGRYFGPPSVSHVRGLRALIQAIEEEYPEIVQAARAEAAE